MGTLPFLLGAKWLSHLSAVWTGGAGSFGCSGGHVPLEDIYAALALSNPSTEAGFSPKW